MIGLRKTSLVFFMAFIVMSCKAEVHVDSLWNKEFACAQDIVDTYKSGKKSIGKNNKELQTLNTCHYVWHSGEYMFKCRGKNEDIAILPKYAEELQLDDIVVSEYMSTRDMARFTDHYFTLQAMKSGSSFEESRDGITMTVFYPLRSMNMNDYSKLQEIFNSRNDALHQAYLKKLVHPLTNSGCNEELLNIRTLIENNVAESELKSKVLALYAMYVTIMPGKPAPDVSFKDTKGNNYTISQFKGKVLVMDIWATWCSSCLKNMPLFMELKKRFSDNDEVEFVTVSTDSEELRSKWITAIEKHDMGGMLNLTPDRSTETQFEEKYHVSSVPRYIVIDKEGNIVSAFAPKPGKELEDLIIKILKE